MHSPTEARLSDPGRISFDMAAPPLSSIRQLSTAQDNCTARDFQDHLNRITKEMTKYLAWHNEDMWCGGEVEGVCGVCWRGGGRVWCARALHGDSRNGL